MKIIWTIDPFEKNQKLRRLGKRLLSQMFDPKDSIECVYVASNSETKLATAFNIPKSKRFTQYPKTLVTRQIRSLRIPRIKVKILSEFSSSFSSAVKKLTTYALESNADLIVTPTRGKSGLERLLLGSFAESLIHYSHTDLLLYNSKTTLRGKPKTIICAHDFSRKSVETIQRLTEYAKKWKASIVIVHIPKSEYSLRFRDQSADVEEYRNYVKEVAAHIERSVKKYDVPCTTYIETNWKLSEVESITEQAENFKADLIAINAKKGRFAALVGGSVTRSVIKKSTVPTLVLKI